MARYKTKSAVTPDYFNALGQATFAFSTLEWSVVCIARRINTDFITKEFYKKWTSGTVKKEFIKVLEENKSNLGSLYDKLLIFTDEFGALIERRNAIVHSQPITGKDGSSMLAHYEFIDSFHWTIDELDKFTEDTEILSTKLNNVLHHEIAKQKE